MAKMTFGSATASQYKKFPELSVQFYPFTEICGKNASGKTSVGMIPNIIFTGKDLTGRSNPEIHPDFMQESEPHITINAEIDGKPIAVEMIQSDTRTQKQKDMGVPAKISNKYKINSVDKTATVFKKDLMEKGIDLDLYETLSNPEVFFSLTEAKKRESVFSLAAEITDLDVADALGEEAQDVRNQLEIYTLPEITAKANAEYKTAKERLRVIPDQIIGLEQAISQVDEDALNEQKNAISEEISGLETKLSELKQVGIESINTEIKSLQLKQKQIMDQHDAERNAIIRSAKAILDRAKSEYQSLQFSVSGDESRLNLLKNQITAKTAEKDALLKEYAEEKKRTFPETKAVCPTCGQKLPKDKLDEIKASWEKSQQKTVDAIKTKGNNLHLEIKKQTEQLDAESVSVSQKRESLDALVETVNKAEEEYKASQKLPMFSDTRNSEFDEITAEITALKRKLSEVDAVKITMAGIRKEIESKRGEIGAIDRELGKVEQNANIRDKIAALESEKGEVSDNMARAQAVLDQVKAIGKKKNEMLSESVNARFPEFIRFKLFYVQKDGEEKDCCIPLIRNENGEWKEVGKTANQALEMRAKLAILEGFQNFHDMHVPVIVDGASELDANSKTEICNSMNTQVIFLSVTEDPELVIREVGA